MISSFALLASPHQSRRIDRVIAAPFQNVHSRTTFPNAKPEKPSAPVKHVDFRNHNFTPLELPSAVTLEKYCGPTTESNWVIPGVLLVGAYPASEDDTETFDLITGILKLGIRKFACLQLEYRDDVPPEQWRNGKGLRPYFQDVKHIVQNKSVYFPNASAGIVDAHSLSFDHLPIVDCGVTDDERVLQLCRKLVLDITRGEVIYLHCWGGHGRTGTVVSIMLHIMYGLSAAEAMARCQLVHDLRICPVSVGSPQTQTQRDQVIRIISELQRQYKLERFADSSNDSLTSTVRISRSGSSDHEDNVNPNASINSRKNSSEGAARLTRNVNSFNSNSGGAIPVTSNTAATTTLPKTTNNNSSNNNNNSNQKSVLLTPVKSVSTTVQDKVVERVTTNGSAVKQLPVLLTGSNNSASPSPVPSSDFHQTIPRPDSNSPHKRLAVNVFRDNNDNDLSDNDSPAMTFHRQSSGNSEGASRSPVELEGLNGSAMKALSMRTPSSEESTSHFKGIATDCEGIIPVVLDDFLPEPSFETERQLSVSSEPTERQLSTASQPMSVSSELSDATPMHLDGGIPIKRNISCTLTPLDAATDFMADDNFSTQVRKASATNANNHNFQQKEPLSQPSGVSYTISQVLNVARQVLLSGGRNGTGSLGGSPTNASGNHNSHHNNYSVGSSINNNNNSSRPAIMTPTPPVGTAPSSKSSRRQV